MAQKLCWRRLIAPMIVSFFALLVGGCATSPEDEEYDYPDLRPGQVDPESVPDD